jgi:hypothetical protein
MPSFICRTIALTFLLSCSSTLVALAGECACSHCRQHCGCEKVCRLVVEEKKVEIVCWGCECEDFCVPGPSCRGCKNCEEVCNFCDDKDPKAPYSKPHKFVWYDWTPTPCANVFTKKKLMKKVITKKVPSYKWVVEDLCPDCESKTDAASIVEGVEIPAPPVKNVKLKYVQAAAATEE